MKNLTLSIIWILLLLMTGLMSEAYVASSTNYQIQSDSINFGGGSSTSTNYGLLDTAGEVGTGTSTSSAYNLNAGYRAMQVAGTISLSVAGDVSLSPSLTSGTAGESAGEASWTVITDNSAGYTLSINAAAAPALSSASDSFADYTPAGASPDYDWTVSASASAFGYSPEGDDVADRFKDNGSTCGSGVLETADQCWDGFSTTPTVMAQKNSSNSPAGTVTTVKFMAEVGANKTQTAGSYSSTITVTAAVL